jgi:hypothetical protein
MQYWLVGTLANLTAQITKCKHRRMLSCTVGCTSIDAPCVAGRLLADSLYR